MSKTAEQRHLRDLGARIFSEANDLKRTPEALAAEINIAPDTVNAVIEGRATAEAADAVVRAMVNAYPVSLADLWVEPDDTDDGVRIMRAGESEQSARVFDRKNRDGGLSPYYEYRDTAMSRTAPFKPEWISQLRTVTDCDPENPDVAYNNGHLMHQCTFFIGEVNFYWKIAGRAYSAEMNTGDSNYVTPYVPHSFASRNPERRGLILAVTYGGPVRQAIDDFARIGADAANDLAGANADADNPFLARLNRRLAAESLSADELAGRLAQAGMDRDRAADICDGKAQPDGTELRAVADALHIRVEDITVTPVRPEDLVSVGFARDTESRPYPAGNDPAYRMTELARNPHQPDLKGFAVTVLGGADAAQTAAPFRHGHHEYIYNYGETAVDIRWGDGRSDVFSPGDSAYVRPMVPHAFAARAGDTDGQLAVIRIPGALTDSVVEEFAAFAPEGRARLAGETMKWF